MADDPAFLHAFGDPELLGIEGARVLWKAAIYAPPGEIWECGVYKGDSARVLAEAIRQTKPRTLRLFDTFAGLPEPSTFDLHVEGEFACPIDVVRQNLSEYGPSVRFHEGVIPDTFEMVRGTTVALAHIDLDLYEPTAAAIDFIWPRLVPDGVLIFDDWQWEQTPGVTQAILERFPEVDVVVTSQRGETGPLQARVRR